MVKKLFKIQICDFVLGFLFLSRPVIFIQSSNDQRGVLPFLNKNNNNKKRFINKPLYEGLARLRVQGHKKL